MMKRWLSAAIGFAMLGGCAGHGEKLAIPSSPAPYTETLADQRWQPVANAARQTLERARESHGLPSLSVAVAIEGQIVWAAASGFADIETKTPATLATRYRIGSTSKAVTATALARLVDQGIMTLDEPINIWETDLPNKAWYSLTPRQLASHTAGIVDYKQNRDIAGLFHTIRARKQFDSVSESLSIFDGNSLKYKPGTQFHYSTFDVILLSAVMESASGIPFPDLIRREVSMPLETPGLAPDHQDRFMRDRATFYLRDAEGVRQWAQVNHSFKWAGGGLIATSSDLAKIGAAWLDPTYIKPATREAFWTPQALSDGQINPQSYAIGWRSNPDFKHPGESEPVWMVHHGGVSKGAYSWLVVYPDLGAVVALNSNARLDNFPDFPAIEQKISSLFFKHLRTTEETVNK